MHEAIGKQEELKPCPWCPEPPLSGRISAGISDMQWVAYCDNIDCPVQPMTDGFDTEAEAISCWNRRQLMTEAANRIQELEAALAQKTRECEELTKELEAANNEFGSETAHWPKLWERIAELKSLSNQRQAKVEQLKRSK